MARKYKKLVVKIPKGISDKMVEITKREPSLFKTRQDVARFCLKESLFRKKKR